MTETLRVAMWSGPRNVSTALMRAFGSRADTIVCDEPLYAYYLEQTGLEHPMAAEIIARHESDWRAVARWLQGPLPAGKSIFYHKHMAHHLLPDVEREWLREFSHAFLIREPGAMLISLDAVIPNPTLADTGLPQQVELFEQVARLTGAVPPVVDSQDLLEDPPGVLAKLCARLGLAFDTGMLSWEPGLRETDGCWAETWYGNALASTGFGPHRARTRPVPAKLAALERECAGLYEQLHEHRIVA